MHIHASRRNPKSAPGSSPLLSTPHPTRRELLLGSVASGAALMGGSLLAGLGCGAASAQSTVESGAAGPVGASEDERRPTRREAGALGVALLGLGNYSQSQLGPSLRLTRHCQLRGIVTGSPGKVPEWQKQYGIADRNVYDYESLPRIADNADIDVVYVVTPTALHAKYAIIVRNARGRARCCPEPTDERRARCATLQNAATPVGLWLKRRQSSAGLTLAAASVEASSSVRMANAAGPRAAHSGELSPRSVSSAPVE